MKVEDLTRQIDEKNALLEKLDAEVRRLELLVKDLRRRLYGSSSERDLGDPFYYQGLLDGLLVQVEEATRKLAEAEELKNTVLGVGTARTKGPNSAWGRGSFTWLRPHCPVRLCSSQKERNERSACRYWENRRRW